jgi:hypothetical protein
MKGFMKNRILSGSAVNLTIVAFLTLLFAGCAVAPKAENLSMATAATHIRADFADDLQPNPSDSPEFTPWGSDEDQAF